MTPFIYAFAINAALALPAFAMHPVQISGSEGRAIRADFRDNTAIGSPGKPRDVTRTIEINVRETETGLMLFEPYVVKLHEGSVVRFVIRNTGTIEHQFFLGSFEDISAHKELMRNVPGMPHDTPNNVIIPAGETAELIWNFTDITNLEFACLIPGHREARMWGVIIVHDHLYAPDKS